MDFKKFLEGDWSTKYHYTSESLTLNDLIESIKNNNVEDLYNKIKNLYEKESKSDKSRADSFEEYLYTINYRIDGKTPLERFYYFLENRFLPLEGLSEINSSRIFCKDSLKKIDWNDLGVCWTFSYNGVDEVINWMDGGKYQIDLYSKINVDNIDWLESVLLNFIFPKEFEIRVKDVKKIKLCGYEIQKYESGEMVKSEGRGCRLLEY